MGNRRSLGIGTLKIINRPFAIVILHNPKPGCPDNYTLYENAYAHIEKQIGSLENYLGVVVEVFYNHTHNSGYITLELITENVGG